MKNIEPVYYKSGVCLPFLGDTELILRIRRNYYIKGTTIETKKSGNGNQYLIIETDNDSQRFINYCVVSYYEKCTRSLIDMQLKRLADLMGISYSGVQITTYGEEIELETLSDFTTQNGKVRDWEFVWSGFDRDERILKFDWRLSMLPMEIIEYLFVVELSHLRGNQSAEEFWMVVEQAMPNYAMCRDWFEVHKEEYENY